MKSQLLPVDRVRRILRASARTRVLVIGDVMLDQFIWGRVSRISPEAPVPVVEFERESFIPGGAANVARNLTALNASADLLGVIGRDDAGKKMTALLEEQHVGCDGLLQHFDRTTSIKTRIIAHQQQVVRMDRETRADLEEMAIQRLVEMAAKKIPPVDAVIVCDYGKGVVTQALLDELKRICRARGIWLSLDPKPVHRLDLSRLSLITPNRKEAFELAAADDDASRTANPLNDTALLRVADKLLNELKPAMLLITLGDQGMLLCQRGQKPYPILTVAREVFDVSGAGDTVIASFTLAIAAGASGTGLPFNIATRTLPEIVELRESSGRAGGFP
ncbi:MAG: carbohydrate kinase [Verrucomicrobia bacterium]|nr:MAG: carbohydrate kinase [Verrucomicrobiota bacterium]